MEPKGLFEAFPTLRLNEILRKLLEEVVVTRVAASRSRSSLRIYIESPRILEKQDVLSLERAIGEQLFAKSPIKVQVIERFRLQTPYSLDRLWKEYRGSILYELQQEAPLEAQILEDSSVLVTEDNLFTVTVEESRLFRLAEKSLRERLTDIFSQRCAMEVRIKIVYCKKEQEGGKENRRGGQEDYAAEAAHQLERFWQADAADLEEPLAKAEPKSGKTVRKEEPPQKKTKGTGGTRSFAKGFRTKKERSPDLIYGKEFDGEPIAIEKITEEMGNVVVQGKVIFLDRRPIQNGERQILIFHLTDYTDTIAVKIFPGQEQWEELEPYVTKGAFLKVSGMTATDRFDHELAISQSVSIKKAKDFTACRMDNAKEKRVELHCHSKMSDMDGVTSVSDLISRAVKWGHPALALTDHGVVQGFTEAFHTLQKLQPDNFKMIYGVEGYLVDDLKPVAQDDRGQSLDTDYVVFRLETTGFHSNRDEIIEIGAVKIQEGRITDRFSSFVNPGRALPFQIAEQTGISDDMLKEAPLQEQVIPKFLEFCGDCVLVAHKAESQMGFLYEKAEKLGLSADFTSMDTEALGRVLLPELRGYRPEQMAKALSVSLKSHHRAVEYAQNLALIFSRFLEMLKEQGKETLAQINAMSRRSASAAKKLPTYHVIILAKNETGRVNLYRLISASHLDYYNRRPRIPKSLLAERREGLIVGSACEAGELFQAVLNNRNSREIARLVKFYDYLEIQPLGNNAFMLRDEKYGFHSEEDLKDLNRAIVRLGEQYGKPVVATGDVHFMDPEDEIYRKIIMAGKGFEDADRQAPLYFHTTEEMLEEFAYLGNAKAREVVVENPVKIAESIDQIEPVRPDKCPPVIEGSETQLREMCYKKARSMYGETLPPIVEDRLEKELSSIIGNGYAVMYIIAQRLVEKSNRDGYLVGSRGSVGSSFAATMAGITEVNPLPPHYYCKHCHYSDFDSPEVKKYAGGAGCDMPDRNCPVCGKPLAKDGFDIPFETFLGFYGDKEPDIDLNFSGEYQSSAHDYTEVIFGKGQTFRAGTIGTLAAKTAFGYVMKYYEERGVHKRRCEVERLASGLEGIRRTTGQHPGGIIVLPKGEEIHSFTPVQHPANDVNSPIITTHFDYHSIDHNLLKLDILGHDDPTMVRRLQDLTGLDPTTIPLDDPKVMSLFNGTEALGVKPEDIGGCETGSLGIPEFGTEFVIKMLLDTKPKSFSDLVRISGLSHGTDVWLNNAQTLIREGKATISTAICTRDDIMLYLIRMGLEPGLAFKIMESVRKGKGLTEEWEKEMLAHQVPDWYIWSCKRIQYMFPKAHAAAYVMMAIRVAYYKVYYPLAYYAAFFSIRATAFNYELMCMGRDRLEHYISLYQSKTEKLTQKEEDTLRDMKIVREMYARGFSFLPIDLYQASDTAFQIIDGRLMPSFNAIDGLGEKAAAAIVEERKKGPFLSKDDFRNRCKISQTAVELMSDLGILSGLPQSDQLSLFDLK